MFSSEITLIGGTHVPWSPCFHYLKLQWLPYLRRMGLNAELELLLAGFYPQGNGQVRARIAPARTLAPLHLPERGALRRIRGISAAANLDMSIAERQLSRAIERLRSRHKDVEIELLDLPARTKGTFLLIFAEFKHASACYVGLGALGKRAEQVADEACLWLEKFLAGTGAIDEHLADQLLLPLAFASGESKFRTAQVTPHLLTNAEVIRAFGVAEITIEKEHGKEGTVRVVPAERSLQRRR
jgi:RNA 3'-phosphate cyclase